MSIFDIFKPKRWKVGKLVLTKFTIKCNRCGQLKTTTLTIPGRFQEPCLELLCECGNGEIASP